MREGLRACELPPSWKDLWGFPTFVGHLAMIYAWTGDKDLAVEQLAIGNRMQNGEGSYGDLKINPQWDSLRGDPRFEHIVASLAPKSAER